MGTNVNDANNCRSTPLHRMMSIPKHKLHDSNNQDRFVKVLETGLHAKAEHTQRKHNNAPNPSMTTHPAKVFVHWTLAIHEIVLTWQTSFVGPSSGGLL